MNEPAQLSQLPEDVLTEQVAWWFLRMHEQDCSAAERRAFERWLNADEAHRREYQQYVELWYNLDQLEPQPQQTLRRKKRSGIV